MYRRNELCCQSTPPYEKIDLFNWQEQAKDMVSQIAFTQMVNVQSETVDRYIREGKIHPDMEVPVN